MIVVINSDILFTTYLIRELPAELSELASSCGKNHIPIVVPQTALFEFEHKQELKANAERDSIRKAMKKLDSYGIDHGDIDLEEVVTRRDLAELLRETGVDIQVEEPTLADYQEAHRRACFHEPPALAGTKSDEMRDLIIWAQSLRLAQERGGLLLLSRDAVHVGPRGHTEASAMQITRVSTVEDALGYLELQSPAGRLAQNLLEEAAEALRKEGVPLSEPVEVLYVRRPSFVQADYGISRATFMVKASTTGEHSLHARISMSRDCGMTRLSLTEGLLGDASIPDYDIEFETPAGALSESSIYEERLEALRQVLGDTSEPTDG